MYQVRILISTGAFLLLFISSCGFYRNCKPTVNEFRYHDRKKLEAIGQELIDHFLTNQNTPAKFELNIRWSRYDVFYVSDQGRLNLKLLPDKVFRRYYIPKVKSQFHNYELIYQFTYEENVIGYIPVPIDENLQLETSHAERFFERIYQFNTLLTNHYLDQLNEVYQKASDYSYKNIDFQGLHSVNCELKWVFYDYDQNQGIYIACDNVENVSVCSAQKFRRDVMSSLYR